jgi:hypothetical protein
MQKASPVSHPQPLRVNIVIPHDKDFWTCLNGYPDPRIVSGMDFAGSEIELNS